MKNNSAKIYVAGHTGLVGSAVVRRLRGDGYQAIITRSRHHLDLTDQKATQAFFDNERPEYVLLCAAKVGGILANATLPAEFIHDNLAIQTNVLHAAWRAGVERLLFLGSSCIFPRDCPQPMKETYLLTGPLEATNRPYAVAKIAGIEMCWAYNRQYGTSFLAVMPTNLYGQGDNYDLKSSHVLPALIRRMHEAKIAGSSAVELWGSGAPRREFLTSDDMVDACLHLLALPEEKFSRLVHSETEPPLVNIGYGKDISIRELADLVAEIVGFQGSMAWDSSKPDGTLRKLLDVSKLSTLGWRAKTPLREGISAAYRSYLASMGTKSIKFLA